MRFDRLGLVFVAWLALGVPGPGARADSWPAPQVRELFSGSGEYFVRVVPGESLGDTRGFAGAKKGPYTTAQFYRRESDRSYRLAAEVSLVHPVAPVEFVVSDHGHLLTLDNWHAQGYGKVVAVYDSAGRLVRAYELSDLFLADEIAGFLYSISSIHWRQGPVWVEDGQRTVVITVREGAALVFGLETGNFKYCESAGEVYRCRVGNQPRQWVSNSQAPLTR